MIHYYRGFISSCTLRLPNLLIWRTPFDTKFKNHFNNIYYLKMELLFYVQDFVFSTRDMKLIESTHDVWWCLGKWIFRKIDFRAKMCKLILMKFRRNTEWLRVMAPYIVSVHYFRTLFQCITYFCTSIQFQYYMTAIFSGGLDSPSLGVAMI